jgi:hypothetical protein
MLFGNHQSRGIFMPRNRMLPVTLPIIAFFFSAFAASHANAAGGEAVLGYIDRVLPESPEARAQRHKRVAERRKGTIVMVHRGATDFAPENTLEAYAAAMDYGADGVEIDIRRTADGVLYLFHDDTLDRMVAGSGKGREHTYYELLNMPFHNPHGMANEKTRIPTLAAFIELARRRAILIHLDIKETEAQDRIVELFDQADIWDHVVHVNPYNSDKIREHVDLDLYDYKGWVEEAGDVSKPEVARRFLDREGKMIFCHNDPRRAGKLLGRPEEPAVVPLPEKIRRLWKK